MPKVPKTRVCARCKQEKQARTEFNGTAKKCKACVGTGVDRLCGGCHTFKSSTAYAPDKRHCRDCNLNKDTAEHVDVCQHEGCTEPFSHERFEWRGTCWRPNCRTCCNKKKPVPADAPDRVCVECGQLYPASTSNHGKKCNACVNKRHKAKRSENCAEADPTTAKQTPCSKCERPFSEEMFKWQGDRWSSWCKGCINGQRYWEKHRQQRMLEDPQGYPEQQAAYRATYFARRRADVDLSFTDFVGQVKSHGRTWEASEEAELKMMILDPCHYCGYKPLSDDPLNHVDRVDNQDQHYCIKSVVTCCTPCNRIKGRWPVDLFLEKAGHVAARSKQPTTPQTTIDKLYRSYSSHSVDTKNACRMYDEHMCYVALHQGYQF